MFFRGWAGGPPSDPFSDGRKKKKRRLRDRANYAGLPFTDSCALTNHRLLSSATLLFPTWACLASKKREKRPPRRARSAWAFLGAWAIGPDLCGALSHHTLDIENRPGNSIPTLGRILSRAACFFLICRPKRLPGLVCAVLLF